MKQLITDQLSDTLDMMLGKVLKQKELAEYISIKPQLEGKIETLDEIITLIQSLRQQEVQNVMTAFYDGTINESNCGKEYYFTSIFQQDKGEIKK